MTRPPPFERARPTTAPMTHGARAKLSDTACAVLEPWVPGRAPSGPAAAPHDITSELSVEEELALVLEAARERGLAEGRAAVEHQRQQLASLCAQLRKLQQRSLDWLAAAALEAAMAVIEAWLTTSEPDRRARLQPILDRWVHGVGAGTVAVARVAAADEAAWRELVGRLPIEIQPDPAIEPGDVRIRSERSMLELRWRDRLAELRGELLAAMPAAPSGDPASAGARGPRAITREPASSGPRTGAASGDVGAEEEAEVTSTRRWRRPP